MVLLHRLTPFALLLIAAAGFGAAMRWPTHPLWGLGAALLLCVLLLARLSRWAFNTASFWNLVLAPALLLASAQGLFLLLETVPSRVALGLLAAFLIFFFAEQVFAYLHAPALYQPFAIQHLSLGMNVLTVFCLGAFAFGARVFLQTPFYVLVPSLTLVSGYVMYQTLWVSKMPSRTAIRYGLAGGLAVGEAFLALALLPTGFYVNAAVLALAAYVYLGLTRAFFLHQLTRALALRYIITAVVLTLAIFGTAAWH